MNAFLCTSAFAWISSAVITVALYASACCNKQEGAVLEEVESFRQAGS